MNEKNLERLSAFMDDELSPAQTLRLLDAMKQDDELRQFWDSGHLIAAAMREAPMASGDTVTGEIGIADSVRTALASEPAILAPRPALKRRSLGPLGGLALAASVAMVAVIATQQALLTRQVPAPQTTAAATPAPGPNTAQLAGVSNASATALLTARTQQQLDEDNSVALTRMTWNDAGPGVAARLNAYLLNHNEYMVGGLHGMRPYARIVGYGSTK